MWDSAAIICIVGLSARMSLSGLLSCVDILRLVIFRGVYEFIVLCWVIVNVCIVGFVCLLL